MWSIKHWEQLLQNPVRRFVIIVNQGKRKP